MQGIPVRTFDKLEGNGVETISMLRRGTIAIADVPRVADNTSARDPGGFEPFTAMPIGHPDQKI
jgi:hypothetical protein